MASANPPTDATSQGTLDGLGFLNGLLRDAIGGYVAVETVRTQKRTDSSVTTLDPVRVGGAAPAAPAISTKTLYIVGGVIVAALLAFLFFRRK